MSHETVAWGELYERLLVVDERLVEEAKRAGIIPRIFMIFF